LGKESAGTPPISSNENANAKGAAMKRKRNTKGVRRVLGSGLGLALSVLGLALSPPVWSQGLVEVVSVNSGVTYHQALGEKYPTELFSTEVRFALAPELTDGTAEAVGPSCYEPENHDLTLRFQGGLDAFAQPRPDLVIDIPAGTLVATGNSGQYAAHTSDPLASLVSVQAVSPLGEVVKVNPQLTRLTVKAQALAAANRYIVALEWMKGVQPPGEYANPALAAARVHLELAGRVIPPDAVTGEASPVSVESRYGGGTAYPLPPGPPN
jgi:hypothetical protein